MVDPEKGPVESIRLSMNEIRMDPFSKREGKSLNWHNVNFTLTKEGDDDVRHLLTDMYGKVPQGNVTAIMGPSGSGKTSLLNILAGRMATHGNLIVEADVRLDSIKINPTDPRTRKLIAFVAQDDSLQETATPREAIKFSAKLRLPKSTTDEEIDHLAERMLHELGLESCADTFVGGPLLKGISGGERKRTSVGVELVVKPEIVFLDEPTSGLDSFSAVQLVNVLKKVSDAGTSVLLTIHQPSSEVFHSLDHVLLLNKGRVMYSGDIKAVDDDFDKFGYPCPKSYNPADHIMMVAQTEDEKDLEAAGFYPKDTFKEVNSASDDSSFLYATPYERVSTNTEIRTLFAREFERLKRNKIPMIARFGITIFLNVLFGLIFWGIGGSDNTKSSNVQSHFGSMVMILISAMFGTAQPALIEFPAERPIFLREFYTNHYKVSSYFMSKFTIEAIVTFTQCMVQAILNYFMIDYQMSFFLFFAILYTLGMAATAVAVLMGAFVKDVGMAQELLPLLFVPQMLFAGFFIASDLIPVFLRWAQYLCSLTYAMRLAIIYEFEDCDDFNCENIRNYTFAEEGEPYVYWLVLLALFVSLRLLAMYSLAKSATAFY